MLTDETQTLTGEERLDDTEMKIVDETQNLSLSRKKRKGSPEDLENAQNEVVQARDKSKSASKPAWVLRAGAQVDVRPPPPHTTTGWVMGVVIRITEKTIQIYVKEIGKSITLAKDSLDWGPYETMEHGSNLSFPYSSPTLISTLSSTSSSFSSCSSSSSQQQNSFDQDDENDEKEREEKENDDDDDLYQDMSSLDDPHHPALARRRHHVKKHQHEWKRDRHTPSFRRGSPPHPSSYMGFASPQKQKFVSGFDLPRSAKEEQDQLLLAIEASKHDSVGGVSSATSIPIFSGSCSSSSSSSSSSFAATTSADIINTSCISSLNKKQKTKKEMAESEAENIQIMKMDGQQCMQEMSKILINSPAMAEQLTRGSDEQKNNLFSQSVLLPFTPFPPFPSLPPPNTLRSQSIPDETKFSNTATSVAMSVLLEEEEATSRFVPGSLEALTADLARKRKQQAHTEMKRKQHSQECLRQHLPPPPGPSGGLTGLFGSTSSSSTSSMLSDLTKTVLEQMTLEFENTSSSSSTSTSTDTGSSTANSTSSFEDKLIDTAIRAAAKTETNYQSISTAEFKRKVAEATKKIAGENLRRMIQKGRDHRTGRVTTNRQDFPSDKIEKLRQEIPKMSDEDKAVTLAYLANQHGSLHANLFQTMVNEYDEEQKIKRLGENEIANLALPPAVTENNKQKANKKKKKKKAKNTGPVKQDGKEKNQKQEDSLTNSKEVKELGEEQKETTEEIKKEAQSIKDGKNEATTTTSLKKKKKNKKKNQNKNKKKEQILKNSATPPSFPSVMIPMVAGIEL